VSDSISCSGFCRIPFGTRVPHPTTLMKITTRCGDDAVTGLNEALLAKAAAAKLLRIDRVRADTTSSPPRCPIDRSGLLAKAIGSMARSVARIKAAAVRPARRHGIGAVRLGRRARSIAAKLKLRGELQRDAPLRTARIDACSSPPARRLGHHPGQAAPRLGQQRVAIAQRSPDALIAGAAGPAMAGGTGAARVGPLRDHLGGLTDRRSGDSGQFTGGSAHHAWAASRCNSPRSFNFAAMERARRPAERRRSRDAVRSHRRRP